MKKKTASKKKISKKKSPKKKVAKKTIAKKTTKAAGRFSAPEFIKKMEKTYSAKLPAIYKSFLLEKRYEKYPKVEMTGFIRGPYFLDFTDPDLANTKELGWNSGIQDMDDCNWLEDYVGYVPLASMSHPKLKEGSKGFLVLNVAKEHAPVLLFDYEGWMLYPLADSFKDFLAGLPNAKNDIATSFCPWDVKGKPGDDDDAEEEKKNYWTLQREEVEEGKHKAVWDALIEKKKTDVPGAIKDLISLSETYPENVFLLRFISTQLRKNGDKKLAQEYLQRGLRLRPNAIFLLMDHANQKIVDGDLAGAMDIVKQIEEGLATTEDDKRYCDSTICAIRGLVYFHQGKKAEALKLLDEADELSFLVSLYFDGFKKALRETRGE